ncbi:MAG: hypothetical protein H6850_01160 [Alphaproteobacteria bacterium]|nr:MAG: hypothetical protein H6850_01160 [Alphaproteobacteria bacterium]
MLSIYATQLTQIEIYHKPVPEHSLSATALSEAHTVALCTHEITEKEFIEFAQALEHNTTVKQLKLRCPISADGAVALQKVLQTNKHLKDLTFSDCATATEILLGIMEQNNGTE